MKSFFEKKITHKSLSFMLDDSAKLIDLVLDSDDGEEIKAKFKLKNVCAQLGEPLIQRLENTLGILNMSKREFLELAIIEALNKADLIMKEVGLPEYLEEASSHQLKSGLKVIDIIEKDGETFLTYEIHAPLELGAEDVDGDISTFKVGDKLEKRGDKYVKVEEVA
jgi:hypothetical protein